MQLGDQRPGLGLAPPDPCFDRRAVDRALEREQRIDAPDRLERDRRAPELGQLEQLAPRVGPARRLDEVTATLLDPRRETIDLAALARTVLDEQRATAPEAKVRLTAVAPDPVRVRGSVELLETVIENLVENAVSFSPVNGEVRVTVKRDRRGAFLVVEDDGPGIPPNMLGRVFERYVSGRSQAKVEGQGEHFGVGLFIVRRNVEALGGTITLENKPSGGLRARITLPLDERWSETRLRA